MEEQPLICKIEILDDLVDNEMLNNTNDQNATIDTTHYAEPCNFYSQEETPESKMDVTQSCDNTLNFSRISNDVDLQIVSQKIRSDPHYLNQLV